MLSDIVGERITTWRKRRGFNRERLAEECAKLGMPELTAAAITNIESGRRQDGKRRRTISVDELFVFAFALNVPPVSLLTPYPDSRKTEALPGFESPSYFTITWVSGDEMFQDGGRHLSTNEAYEKAASEYSKAAEPAFNVRLHSQIVTHRAQLGADLLSAIDHLDSANGEQEKALAAARRDTIVRDIQGADEDIVLTREYMEENGWPPPILPPAIDYLRDKTSDDYTNKQAAQQRIKAYNDYIASIVEGERMQMEYNLHLAAASEPRGESS